MALDFPSNPADKQVSPDGGFIWSAATKAWERQAGGGARAAASTTSVQSPDTSVVNLVGVTQAAYDALASKDPKTLYAIS